MDYDTSNCLPGGISSSSGCIFSFPTDAWMSENHGCAATWMAAVEPVHSQATATVPEYLSKKACSGSIIRNTFIESLHSPPSQETAHCRAHSVPRNIGSDRTPLIDTFIAKPLVVDLDVDNLAQTFQRAPVSPVGTASPPWSPRGQDLPGAKCVLCLSQFL